MRVAKLVKTRRHDGRSRLLGAIVVCLSLVLRAHGQQSDRPITAQEIRAVKTAILDEIYDYRFEGAYIDISALTSRGYMIRLYLRPNLIQGAGQVIYKLPIGEVATVFEFSKDLAVLVREPRDKFPPTSGSTLTLYLNDDVICADKRDWVHETLWILPEPSKAEINAAVMRERRRKGASQHDELREASHRKVAGVNTLGTKSWRDGFRWLAVHVRKRLLRLLKLVAFCAACEAKTAECQDIVSEHFPQRQDLTILCWSIPE